MTLRKPPIVTTVLFPSPGIESQSRRPKAVTCFCAAAILLIGACGTLAADSDSDNVDFYLSFRDPFPVLNQPILAELWVRNRGLVPADVYLGEDCRSSLVLRVTLPNGERRDLEIARTPEGGLDSDCSVSIPPGETKRHRLRLNDWLRRWPTGFYHVAVSIGGEVKASANVEVIERDPARLSEVCRALADVAVSSRSLEADDASKALGFAADEACLPSLVRVLRESRHKEGAILGLARLGTTEALAALVHVWEKLDPGQRSLASFELMKQGRAQALDAALAKAGRQ